MVLSVAWNALVFALTPILMGFFAISDEAKSLVIWLVLINNVVNGVAYPFAGPLGNGLRAAGDVRFTILRCIRRMAELGGDRDCSGYGD